MNGILSLKIITFITLISFCLWLYINLDQVLVTLACKLLPLPKNFREIFFSNKMDKYFQHMTIKILFYTFITYIGSELCHYSIIRHFIINTNLNVWFYGMHKKGCQAMKQFSLTEFSDNESRLIMCCLFAINPEIDLNKPLTSFKTPNSLFTREPLKNSRPINEDNNIIIAPCDGKYMCYKNINALSSFLIKESNFHIKNILSGYNDINKYYGGIAVYIHLDLNDIHRWYSPINGQIKYIESVESVSFDELKNNKWTGTFVEERFFERNARAIIVIKDVDSNIETAFIAIGMSVIDSVNIIVKNNDIVKKGDCLGMFEMGGSAALMLIDNKCKVDFMGNLLHQEIYRNPKELGLVAGKETKLHKLIGQPIAKIRTNTD